MAEPDHQRGDDDHRPVVGAALLEARRDPEPLREPVDAALYDVALPGGLLAVDGFAARCTRPSRPLVDAFRNRGPHAARVPVVGSAERYLVSAIR